MLTTIDRAGRIVVPKAVRDRLGLTPGSHVEISEREGHLLIEPAPVPMRIVRRGPALVVEPVEALPPLTADEVRATLDAGRR